MENLTITKAKSLLEKGEIKPSELTKYYLDKIDAENKNLNAYITINDKIIEQAKEKDKKYNKNNLLEAIPLAVKDVFTTKDIKTTCASKILENYTPIFESTVTKKLLEAGGLILGKTNLDQFCHGSSTETSYFGPSKNPYDSSRLPGGSSGGTAVAIVADLATAGIGTETAGSIRQPSAWCGCVGLKPTYGRVSRYGVIAMGSSLDSPGPMTKTVEDSAYLLGIMAGHDEKDFTSSVLNFPNYYKNLDKTRIKGVKLGVPKEWLELDLDPGIRKNFEESIKLAESLGAEIKYISLLKPELAIAVYTIICRSEVSSNLNRYNGTRYGLSVKDAKDSSDYMESVRGEGFGEEAKRRIMTGKFSLSAGYADKYYAQSELVRQMVTDDLLEKLNSFDAIFGPTTPIPAMKIGEASKNPLFGEMMDVLMEASSLAGLPGISIPFGFTEVADKNTASSKTVKLPVGIQFFSRHFEEQLILDLAYAIESAIPANI